jgi:hypothetical protein
MLQIASLTEERDILRRRCAIYCEMRGACPPLLVQAVFTIAFMMSSGSAAWALKLTRGPYLQSLTGDAVTVVWNTDVAAACSLSIRRVGSAATLIKGAAASKVCAVPVAGLVRGGQYAYVPLADGKAVGEESVFQAELPLGLPYTFQVVGDSGCGCAKQTALANLMLASPPSFVIHTGDMAYDLGAAAEFDTKYFTPYRDLLRRVVIWPSLGNHDVKTSNAQPWLDAFYTSANNAAGSERYYSFDYANAHVTVLDSNVDMAPGTAQYRFAAEDMAATTATWKFLVFHHSVYSSGVHGSATGIRAEMLPLIDGSGIDMVFMGHDHDYERTKPMRGDAVVGAGEGTVFITTGGGGASIRGVGTKRFTAYSEKVYHFVRVAVDGGFLRADMVRMDGTVGDTVTLTKTSGVVEAAASVLAETPSKRPARTDVLYVDGGVPAKRTYFRVRVSDVGVKCVASATLRLQVADVRDAASNLGGRLHQARSCSWQESTLVWGNQPAFDSVVLDAVGAVGRGDRVDFDVSKVVRGDGTFCFVLETASEDGVTYAAREGAEGAPPKLVLTLAP